MALASLRFHSQDARRCSSARSDQARSSQLQDEALWVNMRRIIVPILEEQQRELDKRLAELTMGQQKVMQRQEAVVQRLETLHAGSPSLNPDLAGLIQKRKQSFRQGASHYGLRRSIRRSLPIDSFAAPPPPTTTEEHPPGLTPSKRNSIFARNDTSVVVAGAGSLPGAANQEESPLASTGVSRLISGETLSSDAEEHARDKVSVECPVAAKKPGSARVLQNGKSCRSLVSKLSDVECKFGREYMAKGSLFTSSECDMEESSTNRSIHSLLNNKVHFVRLACKRIVESSGFDAVCAFVICMNTVLIGVEAEVLTVRATPHPAVHLMQTIIIFWFGVELLLRIWGVGLRDFFFGEESRWNWFDFCLVSLAYLDYGAEQLALEGYSTMAKIMRVLRVVRILRSLRIIRVLRCVREFRKMLFAIQGSMQTLLWALFLLFFLLYGFAVCFTTAVAEHLKDAVPDSQSATDLRDSYGTLLRSFYSLYLAMSMGRGWGELVDILLPVGSIFVGLFILFITVTVFGILNVVTSVFVESAMQTAQHYKELLVQDKRHDMETLVGHMRKVFEQIDNDHSGTISMQEFEQFLTNPELRMYVEALQINTADARALFRLLDKDSSGRIDIEEFCQGCLRVKGVAQGFDIHCILYEVQRQSTKWADFMNFVESQFYIVETLTTHLVGVLDPEEGDAAEEVLQLTGSVKAKNSTEPTSGTDDLFSELKSLKSLNSTSSSNENMSGGGEASSLCAEFAVLRRAAEEAALPQIPRPPEDPEDAVRSPALEELERLGHF